MGVDIELRPHRTTNPVNNLLFRLLRLFARLPVKILLHNNIFEILRDRIVFGQYPPGMSLSEKTLCKEFDVSRTPLREAIQKLVDLKLVIVIPRFGTNVTQIDIHD